uniref:PDZ-like domain-containing protein n=1 Tax=Hyaloperonospora arabidopsidis (strain Emoy2) TaxID=559515 RepID=M4C255_HYAAE
MTRSREDGRIYNRYRSARVEASTGESKLWLQSLEKCIRAIVSVRLLSVRAFDGNGASFSVATGFVVDKKRGLILTNRHVVTPGPVVADAIFLNKEEVDLVPVYRDHVHDFGFFRFDPSKVKFTELHEIPLRRDVAKVGAEIRVVGNDAGEKLFILPGILAKLDRDAPSYSSSSYNDFNTFYFAAASSTSGGSSGSPVLNIDGCAIALNAGGAKKAVSSFYLPLNRVVRVMELIQQSQQVSRGNIQTIFRHTAFNEVRLGLLGETEVLVRQQFSQETGMLVADQVIQGGPAHDQLCTGDVLIKFAGKYAATFLTIKGFGFSCC